MDFRPMRRKRQLLSAEMCGDILRRNTSGILAALGDGGYPYAVPLGYVYDGEAIYFHCAKSGHKLDAIRRCEKVSFCVVDQDRVVPEEYTTYFRSAVVFGRAEVLEHGGEFDAAIDKLARKYAPEDSAENRAAAIAREYKLLCMVKITIEHMTGKEAIELVRARPEEEQRRE